MSILVETLSKARVPVRAECSYNFGEGGSIGNGLSMLRSDFVSSILYLQLVGKLV